jgi:hypothetical protein
MLQAATVIDSVSASCKLQKCSHAITLDMAAGNHTAKEYYLYRRQQIRADQGVNGIDNSPNHTGHGCKLQDANYAMVQAATLGVTQ